MAEFKVGDRVRVKEAARNEPVPDSHLKKMEAVHWQGVVVDLSVDEPTVVVDFTFERLLYAPDELEPVPATPAHEALRAEWDAAGTALSFEAWLCELVRELRGNNINTGEIPF